MNHATKKPASRAVKAAQVAARDEAPIPLVPTDKPVPTFRWPDALDLAEETLVRLSGRKQAANALEGMLYVAADEIGVMRLAVLRTVQAHELELIANAMWNLKVRLELAVDLHNELSGVGGD